MTTDAAAAPGTRGATAPRPRSSSDGGDLAIRTRGLRKTYGGKRAVDGIDLDVSRGEVFALLGPNGAGKTTTVEILEGYRTRGGGDVAVLGHDPAHVDRAWRSRIGVVLQSAEDLEVLTVEEVLKHFSVYYPAPRQATEVIELVGLADERRSRVGKLSGGQRRRLDVGLGILGRPELLFLDEPTTGFDPEARRRFWGLVEDLAAEGTTILLTTHYLDEAEHLADRVAVIAAGRILEVAPPAQLGGRATGTARVSWRENERTEIIETREPTRVVRDLGARFGGEVPELAIRRPTLEDVYLSMIAAVRPSDDDEQEEDR